ncbi:MAG: hypothetical protein L3K17_01190 [Thermoplasmata archaeon]|nr:hypothetical protein [Thermoplasmata archaeon]
MGAAPSPPGSPPRIQGIPPGMVDAVLAILASSAGPTKRRSLLQELERRGRRISLAGLNRVLQYCAEAGLTTDGPDGVRLAHRTVRGRADATE